MTMNPSSAPVEGAGQLHVAADDQDELLSGACLGKLAHPHMA